MNIKVKLKVFWVSETSCPLLAFLCKGGAVFTCLHHTFHCVRHSLQIVHAIAITDGNARLSLSCLPELK
jgi:hypothetical protein